MCVILHKPSAIKLKRDIYEMCFKNNDDGAGIAYVKDKQLVVNKGFFDFDEFYSKEIEPNEHLELLIHFRVASPGMVINADNCHPFSFTSKTFDNRFEFALVHNGRIDYPVTPGTSDTSSFTKDVMAVHLDRDPWFMDHHVSLWMLDRIVNPMQHNRNKIAVMRYDTLKDECSVAIMGKKLGVEAHGCWFSNDSYLPPPPKVVHQGGMGYMAGNDFDEKEWIKKYTHMSVHGKWIPYLQWNELMKKERELIQASNPPLVHGWSSLTLYMQEKVIKHRCGFDEFKTDPLIDINHFVNKKDEKSAEIIIIGNGQIKKNDSKMKWLTKAQRNQMRRCALAYCKNAVGLDLENMTWNDMIDWMRHDFRQTETCCADLSVSNLDKFILAIDDQDPMTYGQIDESDKAKIEKEESVQGDGFQIHDMQRGAFD